MKGIFNEKNLGGAHPKRSGVKKEKNLLRRKILITVRGGGGERGEGYRIRGLEKRRQSKRRIGLMVFFWEENTFGKCRHAQAEQSARYEKGENWGYPPLAKKRSRWEVPDEKSINIGQ